MNMTPVIGRGVRWINAERLDSVDCLQRLRDLSPAGQVQQALTAGSHMRDGGACLAGRHRLQDVDARQNGPVTVGRPADEGEDAARRKRNDAPPFVDRGEIKTAR